MANINIVEDSNGELIDLEYFCSDFCATMSENYDGWYGGHELFYPTKCESCDKELDYIRE